MAKAAGLLAFPDKGLFTGGMPKKVKSIVITGNGTNCEMEMAHACRLAGFDEVDIVHISELLYGEKSLDDYHFLNLPGGFLDGDDLGSAKAGANRILHATVTGEKEPNPLRPVLPFHPGGKTDSGRLQRLSAPGQTGNAARLRRPVRQADRDADFQRFRPVRGPLGLSQGQRRRSLHLHKGVRTLYLPVRHGEGKFVAKDRRFWKDSTGAPVAVQYSDENYREQRRTIPPIQTVRWTASPASATRRDGSSA